MPDVALNIDREHQSGDRPLTALVIKHDAGRGYEHPMHSHRRAQIVYVTHGFVTCTVRRGLWMLAPQNALWIPGGMEHSLRVIGQLELYTLNVEPELCTGAPRECGTVAVSPLLRELIVAVANLAEAYDEGGADARLIQTMLDQLLAAPMQGQGLPLPVDRRLRMIAEQLTENPSDRATIDEWAHRVGMSERTLNRMIVQETGMSFGRWRQQYQIMYALSRMAEGETVKAVSYELGYEAPSAFITMFRRVLGQSPARYFATQG